jgi:hypothetical protein
MVSAGLIAVGEGEQNRGGANLERRRANAMMRVAFARRKQNAGCGGGRR